MNKYFVQTCLLSIVASIGVSDAQTTFPRLEGCYKTYGSTPIKRRYVSDIFTNIKMSTVEYGAAVGFTGQVQKLSLNVYEPSEPKDDIAKRPLIVLAHGGSFVRGNKEELDELCIAYTRKGYVCASIDYRLLPLTGAAPTPQQLTAVALFAMHDLKAAIRFFRKSAAGTNPYKINPDFIVTGGISAGSIAALLTTYLDAGDKMPVGLQAVLAQVGGLEGNSGNAGYSSKVKAVINFSGSLPTPEWIGIHDVPLASFHGTKDEVVPYECGMIGGVPSCGSRALSRWATRQGTRNWLVPVKGANHEELYLLPKYRGILGGFVDGSAIFIQSVMCPYGSPHAPDKNASLAEAMEPIRVYPNPSTDQIMVEMDANLADMPYSVHVFDVMGKQLRTFRNDNDAQIVLNRNDFGAGMFFVQVRFDNDALPMKTQKVIFE
jgi:hypothetical protein